MSEYSSKTSSNGEWERLSQCLSESWPLTDSGDSLPGVIVDGKAMGVAKNNKMSDNSSTNSEWDRYSQRLSEDLTECGDDLSDIDSDETSLGDFPTNKYRSMLDEATKRLREEVSRLTVRLDESQERQERQETEMGKFSTSLTELVEVKMKVLEYRSKLAVERAISKELRKEVSRLNARLENDKKHQKVEMEKMSLNLAKMIEEKMKGFEDLSKRMETFEKEKNKLSIKKNGAKKDEQKDDWFLGKYRFFGCFNKNYDFPFEISITKADREGFYVEEAKRLGVVKRTEFRPDSIQRNGVLATTSSKCGLKIKKTMVYDYETNTRERQYDPPFVVGCMRIEKHVMVSFDGNEAEYCFTPS